MNLANKSKNLSQGERFHHPHPRVQKKMEALWLKSHSFPALKRSSDPVRVSRTWERAAMRGLRVTVGQKLPHHQISKLAGISPNTLRSYLKDYQEGGIEKLKEINFYRPQSELVLHRSTLKAYFQKKPSATINEAIALSTPTGNTII